MNKVSAPPRSAPAKGKTIRTGTKMSGNSRNVKRPTTSTKSLQTKEEEYRRMNEELEAKTAELVKEAEHLVKGNLSLLCDLERSTESLNEPCDSHVTSPHVSMVTQSHSNKKIEPTTEVVMATTSVNDKVKEVVLKAEHELDVMEWNQDHDSIPGYYGNNIPETADDMGPEALTRFLKAKLRVMQEEIDRLCHELTNKEKQLSLKDNKVKELTEQNNKLQRTHRVVQPELEKYKKLSESLRHKCSGLESQLVALRKELEIMKGGEKKARSQQSAIEVRLNRALEEVDRYKTELTSLQATAEESSKAERIRNDRLTSDNKHLVKQRNELMTGYKKQLKLIDILKRQKMHIEAAKMLSFTEEEFARALDWKAT